MKRMYTEEEIKKLGGEKYTAGEGIKIENNTISLDFSGLPEQNIKPTLVGYARYSDGTLITNNNSRRTDYIDFTGYKSLTYTAALGGAGCEIAFYDENKAFIQSLSVKGTDRYGKVITIELTDKYNIAKYVVYSVYGSSYFNSVITLNPIKKELDFLQSPLKDTNILIFGDSITTSTSITINEDNMTSTEYSLRNPSNQYVDENGQTIKFSMWPKILLDSQPIKEMRCYAYPGAGWKNLKRPQDDPRKDVGVQIQLAINDSTNPNGIFPSASFEPDIIIFSLGTNDGDTNSTYKEAMDLTVLTPEGNIDFDATLAALSDTRSIQSMRKYLMTVKRKWPYAQLFIQLPIEKAASDIPVESNFRQEMIKMARRYGAVIIDGLQSGIIRDLSIIDNPSTYLRDGLHPTDRGQNMLARTIISSLNTNYINIYSKGFNPKR